MDNASDTTAAAREVIRGWARAAGASADAAGAAVTVETIADAFRGAGLEVRVRHTGMEERMPEPVADFVARLVEEALTHVVRHARAMCVEVDLAQTADEIRITLRDNGIGQADRTRASGSARCVNARSPSAATSPAALPAAPA